MLPHMRGAADPGADVGFSANTSRQSAHLGTSACSQEETNVATAIWAVGHPMRHYALAAPATKM